VEGTGLLLGLFIDNLITLSKNLVNATPFIGSGEEVALTPVFTITFGALGTIAGPSLVLCHEDLRSTLIKEASKK
jgi:hypothetical protein